MEVAQTRTKTGKFVPNKKNNRGFQKFQMSGRAIAFLGTVIAATIGLGLLMATNASALSGTRSISFFNTHTKQNISVTYKRYGQLIPSAMRKLNYILRDWRTDQVVRMDPKLIDLLWEIHTGLGSRKPIHILSGYRSPKTNAMLRRRSRGVGRYSRHMFGMAADVRFPDISIKKLRNYAMRKQRGGVGYYRGSFVHVDVGSVRHWPRMSKRQLARLFPRGRSLHVPRGVARPAGGRVGPRPLPRATVVSSAPAGVVRGNPPNRIKVPSRTQIAAIRPSLRLAGNVPIPRTKPAQVIAATAPVFEGVVPIPRANPNTRIRLAALNAPPPEPTPKIIKAPLTIASVLSTASFFSFLPIKQPTIRPTIQPKREVAIARPVVSTVEVITARPVQAKKQRRGLFGLASLSPRWKTRNNDNSTRVAKGSRTDRRALSPALVNVNRTLKGDRLVSHAALENLNAPIRVASRLGAPDITAAIHASPFRPEQPAEEKSSPFGLLSALLPMFSGNTKPLRRK